MAALCPGTIYINGCCCTFAIVIVCTVVGFTFNLDLFAAAAALHTICCCIRFFLKASAAGFTALAGILPIHYNGLLAAAAVTVVKTVGYGTC